MTITPATGGSDDEADVAAMLDLSKKKRKEEKVTKKQSMAMPIPQESLVERTKEDVTEQQRLP
jgi:hypothetical protein